MFILYINITLDVPYSTSFRISDPLIVIGNSLVEALILR